MIIVLAAGLGKIFLKKSRGVENDKIKKNFRKEDDKIMAFYFRLHLKTYLLLM